MGVGGLEVGAKDEVKPRLYKVTEPSIFRFNAAIAAGKIEGTIVISRDHHDVSGTDSPFR